MKEQHDFLTVVSGDETALSTDTSSGSGIPNERDATVRRLKLVVRTSLPKRRGTVLYDLNQRLVRRESAPTSTSSEAPAPDTPD
jgi:hypothetical protein